MWAERGVGLVPHLTDKERGVGASRKGGGGGGGVMSTYKVCSGNFKQRRARLFGNYYNFYSYDFDRSDNSALHHKV